MGNNTKSIIESLLYMKGSDGTTINEIKKVVNISADDIRRILKEMKAQMMYNKTIDKYFFAQILNNDAAIEFSKILIYIGNTYNIKKLFRYESNINTIIHREEFNLKQKIFMH